MAENTRRKLGWIKEGAGDRFDDLEVQLRGFASITDDARGMAEAIGGAMGVDPDDALNSAMFCVGTVDEVCDLLVRRREEWGVNYEAEFKASLGSSA